MGSKPTPSAITADCRTPPSWCSERSCYCLAILEAEGRRVRPWADVDHALNQWRLRAKERLYGHRRWTTGYLFRTVVACTAVGNDLNDLEHEHPKHQPADHIIDLDAVIRPELPQHVSIGMLLALAGVGTKDARARYHKGCNLG